MCLSPPRRYVLCMLAHTHTREQTNARMYDVYIDIHTCMCECIACISVCTWDSGPVCVCGTTCMCMCVLVFVFVCMCTCVWVCIGWRFSRAFLSFSLPPSLLRSLFPSLFLIIFLSLPPIFSPSRLLSLSLTLTFPFSTCNRSG